MEFYKEKNVHACNEVRTEKQLDIDINMNAKDGNSNVE